MNELTVYAPPQLSLALRQRVARVLAGPARYSSAISGEADFVMPPEPSQPDPDAAPAADALRVALAQPVDRQIVSDWLEALAACVGNAPATDGSFGARVSAIGVVCSDIPAVCWSAETLREAGGLFHFWPSAAEIRKLLSAEHERLTATLRALDAIARAAAAHEQEVMAERRALRAAYEAHLAAGGIDADSATVSNVYGPLTDNAADSWRRMRMAITLGKKPRTGRIERDR
jgi:hypothetical protein